jgi:hypothetical protein
MALTSKTKRRTIIIVLLVLILAALAFVPLPLSSADKELAVSQTLDALLENRLVLTTKGYARLYDTAFIKDKQRVFFGNGLGIADTVFLQHGLKPVPKDRKLDVDSGDVIVSFGTIDLAGKQSRNVQFSYVFGSFGAHGYEIKIYKTLFQRRFLYVHQWVS